jgi:hypothetical protein
MAARGNPLAADFLWAIFNRQVLPAARLRLHLTQNRTNMCTKSRQQMNRFEATTGQLPDIVVPNASKVPEKESLSDH